MVIYLKKPWFSWLWWAINDHIIRSYQGDVYFPNDVIPWKNQPLHVLRKKWWQRTSFTKNWQWHSLTEDSGEATEAGGGGDIRPLIYWMAKQEQISIISNRKKRGRKSEKTTWMTPPTPSLIIGQFDSYFFKLVPGTPPPLLYTSSMAGPKLR